MRLLRRHALAVYTGLALAYLFAPIAYLLVFSFNDSRKTNVFWSGFTFDNWRDPCAQPALCPAVGTSLAIGALATVLATALGTLAAFALTRHRFAGRRLVQLLIFLPMATPEVVLGASLLTLFLNARAELGFWTTIAAHVMFCLSFVVVAVKARIATLDPQLEQAAMDLYATEWQTFRRVTLPLVAPGVLAAALLAFSLSFDDYIITSFNSGTLTTFPEFVYISAARGVPAEAYVVGVAMFFAAFAVVLVTEQLRHRRRGRVR